MIHIFLGERGKGKAQNSKVISPRVPGGWGQNNLTEVLTLKINKQARVAGSLGCRVKRNT